MKADEDLKSEAEIGVEEERERERGSEERWRATWSWSFVPRRGGEREEALIVSKFVERREAFGMSRFFVGLDHGWKEGGVRRVVSECGCFA